MSAEMLRKAASLMRERAEAARFFWSELHPRAGQECPWHTEEELRLDFDEEQGPHIASWHPAVALAVAGWLDDEAIDLTEQYDGGWAPSSHALAVARAYLGESE